MHPLIPLHYLKAGDVGRVGEVLGHCDQVHRLEELGVRRGVSVEMVKRGNPCIIRLSGHKLCFRGDELLTVMVAQEPQP